MKRKLQREAESFYTINRRTLLCHASTLAAATAAGSSFSFLSCSAAAAMATAMAVATAAITAAAVAAAVAAETTADADSFPADRF